MFAGIIHLDGAGPVDGKVKAELRSVLSRHPGEVIRESSHAHAHFAYCSVGALSRYPGFRSPGPNQASFLVGQPLLSPGGPEVDHEIIDRALADGDEEALRRARGVFCLARYSESPAPVLELVADKLGVRPIYYRIHGGTVVCSTALRVVEDLSFLRLRKDLRGISESLAFGYPLADRTVYEGVKTIREAEIIRISPGHVGSIQYWRWDRRPLAGLGHREAIAELSRLFREAVVKRNGGDPDALAVVLHAVPDKQAVMKCDTLDLLHAAA